MKGGCREVTNRQIKKTPEGFWGQWSTRCIAPFNNGHTNTGTEINDPHEYVVEIRKKRLKLPPGHGRRSLGGWGVYIPTELDRGYCTLHSPMYGVILHSGWGDVHLILGETLNLSKTFQFRRAAFSDQYHPQITKYHHHFFIWIFVNVNVFFRQASE